MDIKKIQQLGVVLLGAFVVSGCPSPTESRWLANSSSSAQEAVAQEAVAQEAVASTLVSAPASTSGNLSGDLADVSFEVCATVDGWQRPSNEEQAKQLSNIRYGESVASGSLSSSLKTASAQFWDHQVISFTTYGLSARMEPETLSGVWTAASEMAGCYEPETTVAINEGDRAETWLLNHRISDLQWKGDRYVMTVEPASTGMQVIQFDRVDELASLPLDVVTANGDAVDVFSGDWE
jgi:hypothetical protein